MGKSLAARSHGPRIVIEFPLCSVCVCYTANKDGLGGLTAATTAAVSITLLKRV